jgi:hypothetical protein
MGARVRLAAAVVLFGAWIGWLAYLAATTSRPTVLSRPQFLVSTLDVIARVDDDHGRPGAVVHVLSVRWPAGQQDEWDRPITVTNLSECRGWTGPGEYILPLVADGDNYRVAGIPPSPGYPGGAPRIYSRTPEMLAQLESVAKAEPATGSR